MAKTGLSSPHCRGKRLVCPHARLWIEGPAGVLIAKFTGR